MELALPVFLAAMVLIGAVFTLRHRRAGRTGLMVLMAVLVSFGVYFLRNFAQVLGESGEIPARARRLGAAGRGDPSDARRALAPGRRMRRLVAALAL